MLPVEYSVVETVVLTVTVTIVVTEVLWTLIGLLRPLDAEDEVW